MPSEERRRAHFDFIVWALRHAAAEPTPQRIRLYRSIAEVCGEPAGREELLRRAADLERADQQCQEFTLTFEAAHAGAPNLSGDGADGGDVQQPIKST